MTCTIEEIMNILIYKSIISIYRNIIYYYIEIIDLYMSMFIISSMVHVINYVYFLFMVFPETNIDGETIPIAYNILSSYIIILYQT